MKSKALAKLHKEIGNSIHAMNTIAVGLSRMPDHDIEVPEGLNISWKPENLNFSKKVSRSYAEKSAIIYATESLYEYLRNISVDPFWTYPENLFDTTNNNKSKAEKVYTFLSNIPNVDQYLAILVELLCHWRNKIVHLNSQARLSKNKVKILIENKNSIFKNIHRFDVEFALNDYKEERITLKDASTLITIAIKCAELTDRHYFDGILKIKNVEDIINKLEKSAEFRRIFNQDASERRTRQIKMWIKSSHPYFNQHIHELIDRKIPQ